MPQKRSFCSHFICLESMILAFKFNMEEKYITYNQRQREIYLRKKTTLYYDSLEKIIC